MPRNKQRSIATIVAAMLFCVSAHASDIRDGDSNDNALTAQESAEVKRDLARIATTLAAQDAIAGVNRAMRRNLDRRLNDQPTTRTTEKSADGR